MAVQSCHVTGVRMPLGSAPTILADNFDSFIREKLVPDREFWLPFFVPACLRTVCSQPNHLSSPPQILLITTSRAKLCFGDDSIKGLGN